MRKTMQYVNTVFQQKCYLVVEASVTSRNLAKFLGKSVLGNKTLLIFKEFEETNQDYHAENQLNSLNLMTFSPARV